MTKQFYRMERKAFEEFWAEENAMNPKPEPESWFSYLNPFKTMSNVGSSEATESFEGGTTKGEFEMTDFGSSTYHNSMSNSRQQSTGFLAGLLVGRKNYGDSHEN